MKFKEIINLLFRPDIFIKNWFKSKPDKDIVTITTHIKQSKYLWILDNGHGVNTAGKRYSHPNFIFHEWDFTRSIVKLIANKLSVLNIDFYVLVPENKDVPINLRVNRANLLSKNESKDCITISVHANAESDKVNKKLFGKAVGTETLYHYNSERGRTIANIFQAYLVHGLLLVPEFYSRGIKGRGDLGILKGTDHPAIITEVGFYTNVVQASDLNDPLTQNIIAEAHVQAIQFLENL